MNDKITLFIEEVFDSFHYLENYDGKCKQKHYCLLQIWIQGDDRHKDDVGILFDFGNIKKIKDLLDNKEINVNPTAENITNFIIDKLLEYDVSLEYRVRLYETAVRKEIWCQRQTDDFDINYL